MSPSVDLFDALAREVGVQLRRGDARMAEQFLDHPQVCATFEQVCCEGVPQQVRMQASLGQV